MPRADLTKMLDKIDEAATVPPAAEKPKAAAAPAAIKRTPGTATQRREPAPPAATGYRSYERKEARLRPDQYARLTEESRRLNRAKATGGERITENTLIRIAIDLLLERADHLAGSSESELRKSVTL